MGFYTALPYLVAGFAAYFVTQAVLLVVWVLGRVYSLVAGGKKPRVVDAAVPATPQKPAPPADNAAEAE